MATPILPTRTKLRDYSFSPAQLVADAEVEAWLTAPTGNNYDFILELIQAFRSGARASWANTGVTPTTDAAFTEFVYFCDLPTLNTLIDYLTNVTYGYLYTVKVAKTSVGWETRTTAISTTPSNSYVLVTGTQSGKYALLVSWA
jgi:hypothetical protein